ncbi:MAG: hypothetical protein Q9202_005395 [Teloschistes flavicans]
MASRNPINNTAVLRQRRLAESLFSLKDGSVMKQPLLDLDQIQPLIEFFETSFQKNESELYQPVREYCGFAHEADIHEAGVQLVETVADIMRQNIDRQISIDKVIREVSERKGQSINRDALPAAVRQGMFGLFGLVTLLYTVPDSTSTTHISISAPRYPFVAPEKKIIEDFAGPLGELIGSFGQFTPLPRGKESNSTPREWPKAPKSQVLSTSVVNIDVLIKVSKIHVVWSDLLSAHLLFDRTLRTLTLFRFPSFCALNLPQGKEMTLFDRIMDDWSDVEYSNAKANHSLFRETLLSYRLLVGQNPRSRAWFKKETKNIKMLHTSIDPLLIQLCGEKRSLSSLVSDDRIQEQAYYDSNTDFGFYKDRLEELEEYISARKVRNIKELWYDRRDPGQWVLVWVFLIVGGAAVFLSIVQVALAAAQLAYSVPSRSSTLYRGSSEALLRW